MKLERRNTMIQTRNQPLRLSILVMICFSFVANASNYCEPRQLFPKQVGGTLFDTKMEAWDITTDDFSQDGYVVSISLTRSEDIWKNANFITNRFTSTPSYPFTVV